MVAEWWRRHADLVPGDGMEITVVQVGNDTIEVTFDVDAAGDQGDAGTDGFLFLQEGEVVLATGSEPAPFPVDAEIVDVIAFMGTPPTDTDVQVDVLVNNDSLWASANSRPIVPAGEYTGVAVAPETTDFSAGDLVTVDVTQVGAPSSGGGVVTDVRDVSTGFNTLTSTVSSINIPIPATYQVGDLLLTFIVIGDQTVSALPSGWVELEDEVVDAAPSFRLYTLAKIAESGESALQVVTLSGGTPAQAVTLSITNPLAIIGQPDDTATVVVDSAAANATLGALDTTEDNTLGVWAYATRLTAGAQNTLGLHADLTEDYNATTTRGAATNLVLAIAHKQYPSPATTSAYQATSAASGRWLGRNLGIFMGPTGDTPGENLYVRIRWRPL